MRKSSPLGHPDIAVSDVDLDTSHNGTVRTSSMMNNEPEPLYQKRAPQYHDSEKMVEKAKVALKEIKYDQKIFGSTLFDKLQEFDGWNFISEKIFELPRNEKFIKVLEQR